MRGSTFDFGLDIYSGQGRKYFQNRYGSEEELAVLTQVLNMLGAQGWELVNHGVDRDPNTWTLKRRR